MTLRELLAKIEDMPNLACTDEDGDIISFVMDFGIRTNTTMMLEDLKRILKDECNLDRDAVLFDSDDFVNWDLLDVTVGVDKIYFHFDYPGRLPAPEKLVTEGKKNG